MHISHVTSGHTLKMVAFSRWWRGNLGKGTILGNANYASTRKYNCRDILGIRVLSTELITYIGHRKGFSLESLY